MPTISKKIELPIEHALRQCKLLSSWPDDALSRLATHAVLKRHHREAQIDSGDALHPEILIVVSGSFELSQVNAEGNRFVLSVHGPGGIVGLVYLIGNVASHYHYRIREDTVLLHIPVESLRSLLDARPELWRDVAIFALARQEGHIGTIQTRALASIEQRISHILMRLANWSGKNDEGNGITLKVSQSDLAAMVSVSRQTINRELSRLAELGVISVEYGRVTIRDIRRIRALGEGKANGERVIRR